jgi:type IV secretory pathway protease TraF
MTLKAFLPLGLAYGFLGVTAVTLVDSHQPPVIINETASMARGAYFRTGDASSPRIGDIVALPMNQQARAYLTGQLGYPAESILIKRVVAIAGDRVCHTGNTTTARDTTLPVRSTDSRGNSLPVWTDCRRLAPGEIFLAGDAPGSFDGRHLGPTNTNVLIGQYKEAITW